MTDRDEILRVYLVFNGSLGMSPGKMAAQAFQACQRLLITRCPESFDSWEAWLAHLEVWEKHTTTIARVAKTPVIFERVCGEVPGVVMVDEGYTEVPAGSVTCFASLPMLMSEAPKILSNAKVPLL